MKPAYLLCATHLCDSFAPLETHLRLYLAPHLLLDVSRGVGGEQQLDLLDPARQLLVQVHVVQPRPHHLALKLDYLKTYFYG